MRALCRAKVQESIPKIAGSRSPCTSGHPSAADFLAMWMSHRDDQVVIRLQNFGDLRQRKASINPGAGDQFKPRHNKLIWQRQLFPKLLFQGTERLANDFHFMGDELSHGCSRRHRPGSIHARGASHAGSKTFQKQTLLKNAQATLLESANLNTHNNTIWSFLVQTHAQQQCS